MLNTLRLTIRPFTFDDIDESLEWFFDNAVMSSIPTGPDKSLADVRKRIGKYIRNFELFGFSKYLLIDKATGEKIGDAGILKLDGTEAVDIGSRLKRNAWGRGYATEACSAIIAHSFEGTGVERIQSMVGENDAKAIHMLNKKLNFDWTKDESFFGLRMKLFELTNDKYAQSILKVCREGSAPVQA